MFLGYYYDFLVCGDLNHPQNTTMRCGKHIVEVERETFRSGRTECMQMYLTDIPWSRKCILYQHCAEICTSSVMGRICQVESTRRAMCAASEE